MSPRSSIGSTDPSLHGPLLGELNDDIDPAVRNVISTESIQYIEDLTQEMDALEQTAQKPNPFEIRYPNQVDLSVLDPAIIDDIRGILSKKQKTAPTLNKSGARGIKKFIDTVKDQEFKVAANARQANSELAEVRFTDLKEMQSQADDADAFISVKDLEGKMGTLYSVAAKVPSSETIRTLEVLWDTALDFTERHQSRVEKASNPSSTVQRPFVGFFRGSHRVERALMTYAAKSLKRVREITEYLSDSGSKTHAGLVDVTRKEQEKHASRLLICTDDLKNTITDISAKTDPANLPELIAAEDYLVRRAQHALDVFFHTARQGRARENYQELIEESTTPYIAQAYERSKQQAAAELNKQFTEANDILVGGRRLKPNKALRHPDKLSDALDKILNGDGQTYRIEKGIMIAILSERFESFARTVSITQSAEPDDRVETIRETRSKLVDELSSLPIDSHIENIEIILEVYDKQLQQLLEPGQIEGVHKLVKQYLNKNPEEAESDNSAMGSPTLIESVFKHHELLGLLDWTVLPIEEGEESLEDAAREIVKEAQERAERGRKVEIDLNRLNILKQLREQWGKDRCEYFRGTLRNSGAIEGSDRPDEYIVLVMRELDAQGNVSAEHAVAESPIVRENALYLLRADVAAGSWREVFSMPKKDARTLGARRLLHTKGDGRPLVDLLSERVQTLLTCSEEDFFRIRFQGPSFWLKKLGAVKLQENPQI